jgi:hypothetical protein
MNSPVSGPKVNKRPRRLPNKCNPVNSLMDEQLAKLIQLYGMHDVASIEADPALTQAVFGKSRMELYKDRNFTAYEATVKREKQRIERYEDLNNPDTKTRVGASLELLWLTSMSYELKLNEGQISLMQKYEVLQQLLWKMFSDKWSIAQKHHFEYYATRIPEWYNCFISYTNHGAKEVNDQFMAVIKKNLLSTEFKERDLEKDNMLPDVIKRLINRGNLEPLFFDKHEIRSGQSLSDRIEAACIRSFVFIQVMDKAIFKEVTPNWPFQEYQIFEQESNKLFGRFGPANSVLNERSSALVAAQDRASALPLVFPLHYQTWANTLLSAKRHEILPTDPEQFSSRLMSVMSNILRVIMGMLKTVPA